MEKEMKCFLLLTLKEMSLRTVVALSFSGPDALAKASQDPASYLLNKRGREYVENIVKDKLTKLELPLPLLEQAKNLVRPIGEELRRWIESHYHVCEPFADKCLLCLPKFCWTSVGKIDDRETAKNMACSVLIDLDTRYRVACTFCLEDSIRRLWMELPEERKAHYLSMDDDYGHLEHYWAHILSDNLSSMNHWLRKGGRILTSFNQWGFERSAENGNRVATKYFFEKLTITEREASLMRTAIELIFDAYHIVNISEIIHYLLTVMTPEERREMVEKFPSDVLLLFLDWPLQGLFVENASFVWTYLPPDAYCRLLSEMLIRLEWKVDYSPELFPEFFIQSPPELKKCFANERDFNNSILSSEFLHLFFKHGDLESIRVMFRNVEEEERVKIVFDIKNTFFFFQSVMEGGRWQMVEVCLREATLSEEDKQRWKEDFMEHFGEEIGRGQPEWKEFFEFFDEASETERGHKRNLDQLLDEGSSKL